MDREGQKEGRAMERMEEVNKNKNKQSKRPKKMLKIKEIQNKNEFNRDKFPVCQILPCINKINIVLGETELSIHGENERGLGGGVMVSINLMNEQSQAKQIYTTQVLDDTRDFVGLAPGTDTAKTEVSLDQ